MKSNVSVMRGTIKSAYRDLQSLYNETARRSRSEALAMLKPGQIAPEEGKIYGDAHRANFAAAAGALRHKATEAVQQYKRELDNDMLIAPSEEAMRVLQAFSLEKADSNKERYAARVKSMADKFGDNYTFYRALVNVAAENGVHALPTHPLEVSMENCEAVTRSINSAFDSWKIENDGGVSDGRREFFDMSIDSYFPD